MNMKLGQYFTNAGQQSAKQAFINARNDLKKIIRAQKISLNAQELEGILNDIYYPPSGNLVPLYIDEYQKLAAKDTEERLYDEISNLNLVEITNNVLNGGGSEYYKKSKETISKNKFEKIMQNFERKIGELSNILKDRNDAAISNVLTWAKDLYANASAFLYDVEIGQKLKENKYFSKAIGSGKSRGQQAIELVKLMSAFIKAYNRGAYADSQVLGPKFEETLSLISHNAIARSVDALYTKTAKWVGKDSVQRGMHQGKSNSAISFEIDTSQLNTDDIKMLQDSLEVQEANMKITYKRDAGSEKMGKTDVSVDYSLAQDIADPFRQLTISAKSWRHKNRSFGGTSIEDGFIRTVGPNLAIYYRYALLDPKKDEYGSNNIKWDCINEAHELAKLALVSDIIMGIKQGNGGMANTLIIDNGSHIYVRDISNLILSSNNEFMLDKNFSLIGYEENSQKNVALENYRKIKGINTQRSNIYQALMANTLAKKQVQVIMKGI